MHALRSSWKLLAALGLAAFVVSAMPAPASALPLPINQGARQFRLMAKAISFINVNRVYCGVNNIGNVCVDSAGRGTVQGGYWPRGTPDNYVFNSGLQVAGIIQGTKPDNPWAGDTTGGWFFDGAGGRQQTEGVTQVYQAFNSTDLANWPADAYVPQGDSVADLYAPALQGLKSASQGDTHFIAWEGNPNYSAARDHPLGIMVDYRLLAWNYPAGAQDVVFLVATIYNITSVNPADYAQHRAGIRPDLIAQATKFQQQNDAKFNIQLPQGGYTIGPMYIGFAGDNDVGNANDDYNGVFLPFAMGYTYEGEFDKGTAGWTFDPTIFAAPFFPGVGFVGFKYLKGPDGPGKIQLMTTFCNGNCGGTTGHADPASTIVNFRLLAGTPAPTDGQCDVAGIPAQTHICFMLFGSNGADTRMAESSTPLTLAPGQAKTLVTAYVFAPPVAVPGFTPNNGTNTDPGNPTWSEFIDSIQKYPALNVIDRVSGYVKYTGPLTDPDDSKHVPVENDFQVVKGSLLGKANVAQAVFDVKFLQEFAPDAPDFFLIPGDKQVTVLWKPSDTETLGDPFYQVVKSPTEVDANGATIANPLYDPNYRQFDVEGYRVYRGRSDTPSSLVLLAQFDYAGTTFKDYTGAVENGNCAPEIGITTDCPVAFPTAANPTPPLTAPTKFQAYNIGPQPSGGGSAGGIGALAPGAPLVFVDQSAGNRLALAGGTTTITTVADTAVVTAGVGQFPPLADTGVPFVFVDKAGACGNCGVNNGIVYFYTVTAFDVNAPGHGPTSLESAKVTKQVIPGAPASNYVSQGTLTVTGPNGRDGQLTDNVVPTIDSATGEFSKKFPPTNAISVSIGGFVTQVLNAGTATVSLDSIILNTAASGGGGDEAATDWFSVSGAAGSSIFSIPISFNEADVALRSFNASAPGLVLDSALSSSYGGGAGYSLPVSATVQTIGAYVTGIMGRGCINAATSAAIEVYFDHLGTGNRPCVYNGPRWFVGDNETTPNPNSDNPDLFDSRGDAVTFSNSGGLPGVTAIWRPVEYFNTASTWRDFGGAMSPFIGDADYRLYWGDAGKVDSVIDLTHNTVVPFDTRITDSYGILNGSAVPASGSYDGRSILSFTDVSCVSNFETQAALQALLPCSAPAVSLSQTAIPGPIVLCDGPAGGASYACVKTAAARPNNGFLLYIKGHIFMFELTGGALPSAGTAWTMRDYTGGIEGGSGNAGNFGPYRFTPTPIRPVTAVGLTYKADVTASNTMVAASKSSLAKVHTVPDPYYVTSAYDIAVDAKQIQFVNVPLGATIRIYSSSGVLLRVLTNNSTNFSGIVIWDVRNRTNQYVSSGVYFYNVESGGVNYTGRMTIVNYASTVQ